MVGAQKDIIPDGFEISLDSVNGLNKFFPKHDGLGLGNFGAVSDILGRESKI